MFAWLRRLMAPSKADQLRQFLKMVDELNARAGGGEPLETKEHLCRLKIRSGSIVLSDPQYLPGLEIQKIDADSIDIAATVWRYPAGHTLIAAIQLDWSGPVDNLVERKIGEVAIDSAKLVIADKADIDEHWTVMGKDRIGVITTAPHETLLRELMERFHLKTVQVNMFRAEVVGAISSELEEAIYDFLKSDQRYANLPFLHFHVQTNNSFDRANFMSSPWALMPVGNLPEPKMLVCGTGRGDGRYDVRGKFDRDTPKSLSINFIDD